MVMCMCVYTVMQAPKQTEKTNYQNNFHKNSSIIGILVRTRERGYTYYTLPLGFIHLHRKWCMYVCMMGISIHMYQDGTECYTVEPPIVGHSK